jgi:hypothetical protein
VSVSEFRVSGAPAERHDDLVLLTTPAMRARRHPWALLGLWAWQTSMAMLAAWPAASLARAVYGNDPRGDAPLWAPGAHALVDLLWHEGHGLSAAVGSAEVVLAFAAIAGLVPMAGVMFAIAYATRERRPAGLVSGLAGALRVFPAMALLLVLVALAQALVVGAGLVAASFAEGSTHAGLGEARAQQVEGLVGLLFLVASSVLGVVHDLARAVVVRFRVRGLAALKLAAWTFRLAPASLWWSWAWRAGAAWAPVLVAAGVAERVAGRGGFALFFLALLHQAVVLSRLALHTSWWAKALRSVDSALKRVAP